MLGDDGRAFQQRGRRLSAGGGREDSHVRRRFRFDLHLRVRGEIGHYRRSRENVGAFSDLTVDLLASADRADRQGHGAREDVEHILAPPGGQGVAVPFLQVKRSKIEETHGVGGNDLLEVAVLASFDQAIHEHLEGIDVYVVI